MTFAFVIVGCDTWIRLTRALKHLQHVLLVILDRKLTILQEKLTADHVVLCQRASLV